MFIRASISFVLIAAIGIVLFTIITAGIEEGIDDHLAEDQRSLSRLIAIRVEDFFGDIEHELSLYAEHPEIKYPREKTSQKEIIKLANSLRDKASSVSRMDSLGVLRLAWPDTNVIGQNIAYQKHVIKTLDDHKAVISQPILAVQGFQAIVIHEPIFGDDSIWLGNICALVPFENIEGKMLSELRKIGAEGFIVDSTGEILYHPDLAPGTMLQRALSIESSVVLERFVSTLPGSFEGAGRFIDHSGVRKDIGITTINLGDYRWFIGVYREPEKLFTKLNNIVRNQYLVLGIILIATAAALIYLLLYSRRIVSRKSKLDEIESVAGKNRIIDLISKGLHALVAYDNEKKALQSVVDGIMEIGGASFVGLFRKTDRSKFVFVAHSYRFQEDLTRFLEVSDIDPFKIEVPFDFKHPIIQSLENGEIVKIASFGQLENLDTEIVQLTSALKKVFMELDIYVVPVKAKGDFLGAVICCIPLDSPLKIDVLDPFIDQVAQVLLASNLLRRLRDSNALYADIFHNVDFGIHIVDSDLRLLSFNKFLEREFGIGQDDIGKTIGDVFSSMETKDFTQNYYEVFKTGRGTIAEETTFTNGLETRYARTKLIPIFSTDGNVERVMTMIEDVTGQVKISAELRESLRRAEKLAYTDGLTGLYNDRYFTENIPHFMEMAREAKANLCLIILDLDDFKRLNDSFGHRFGDRVLRAVARIIEDRLSAGDIAARYGGDEFAIILRNMEIDAAVCRADVIRTNIEDKVAEIVGDGCSEAITASFGAVAMTDDVKDEEDLLCRADRALNLAKTNGRNRVEVWKPED